MTWGQGVNSRVHLVEQKDLLIVVQDCKTYFWRGNIFISSGPLGVQKERKGGSWRKYVVSLFWKWKSVFLFDAFQGKLPLLMCWSNPLYIEIFWPRNWNVVIITLFCFLPSQEKAFNRVIFTKKPSSKLGLKMGTYNLGLWYFFSDSSTARLHF